MATVAGHVGQLPALARPLGHHQHLTLGQAADGQFQFVHQIFYPPVQNIFVSEAVAGLCKTVMSRLYITELYITNSTK